MAYSRFGYSDIYIYPNTYGSITCSGCFALNESIDIQDDKELICHISLHKALGHDIPIDLEQEILNDTDRYKPYSQE
mgnify:CR=1 FL=1